MATMTLSYKSRPILKIEDMSSYARLPTEEKAPPKDIEWGFTRPSESISKVVLSGLQQYTALEDSEKKIY
jgi:hypothetical protein